MLTARKRILTGLFAIFLGLPAVAARAADPCTHSYSISGSNPVYEYVYLSGSWQYVGSSLMHVHTDQYIVTSVYPTYFQIANYRTTAYCSK